MKSRERIITASENEQKINLSLRVLLFVNMKFNKALLSKKALLRYAVLVATILFAGLNAAIAQSGIIAGVPSTLTVHEGNNFSVYWYISPGSTPVSAVDFVLSFNPEEIEALEIFQTESPLSIQPVKPAIDNERGRITYSAFKLQSPWPDQPFIFTAIKFKAIKSTPATSLYHNLDELPNTTMAFEGNITMKEARHVLVHILDPDPRPVGKFVSGGLTITGNEGSSDEAIIQFTASETGTAGLTLVSTDKKVGSIPIFTGQVNAGVDYTYAIPVKMLPTHPYDVELHIGSQIQTARLSK